MSLKATFAEIKIALETNVCKALLLQVQSTVHVQSASFRADLRSRAVYLSGDCKHTRRAHHFQDHPQPGDLKV